MINYDAEILLCHCLTPDPRLTQNKLNGWVGYPRSSGPGAGPARSEGEEEKVDREEAAATGPWST